VPAPAAAHTIKDQTSGTRGGAINAGAAAAYGSPGSCGTTRERVRRTARKARSALMQGGGLRARNGASFAVPPIPDGGMANHG